MAYDPGALDTALAAAVGNDPMLVKELRDAFLESAHRHLDALGRARCDGNWRMSACRLQGLAGSFGAVELMELAEEAANGPPGDPVALRRIGQAISAFSA